MRQDVPVFRTRALERRESIAVCHGLLLAMQPMMLTHRCRETYIVELRLLLPFVVTAAALPFTSPVQAKCRMPPIELLWSYPADGDVDVPTNAVFWSLNKYWYANPTLTLNGVSVATTPREANATSAPGTPLGSLAPQHDYVLRLEFPQPALAGGGTAQPIEIAFRTGDGPAERLPPLGVLGDRQTPDGPNFQRAFRDAECSAEIEAQDCFDTGPNVLIHFDVEEPRAVGFVVDGALWPARCGHPALYRRYFPSAAAGRPPTCFDLQAIGPGGLLSEATEYCVVPDSATPVPADSEQDRAATAAAADGDVETPSSRSASSSAGCSVTPTAAFERASLSWLLALTGVLGLRRLKKLT